MRAASTEFALIAAPYFRHSPPAPATFHSPPTRACSVVLCLMVPRDMINPDATFAAAFVYVGLPWASHIVALGALLGKQQWAAASGTHAADYLSGVDGLSSPAWGSSCNAL